MSIVTLHQPVFVTATPASYAYAWPGDTAYSSSYEVGINRVFLIYFVAADSPVPSGFYDDFSLNIHLLRLYDETAGTYEEISHRNLVGVINPASLIGNFYEAYINVPNNYMSKLKLAFTYENDLAYQARIVILPQSYMSGIQTVEEIEE
jgi:hypothetical protein